MKALVNFLRKIGLLQVSKGDYNTGEFDNRKDLKEEPATPEAPAAEAPAEEPQQPTE